MLGNLEISQPPPQRESSEGKRNEELTTERANTMVRPRPNEEEGRCDGGEERGATNDVARDLERAAPPLPSSFVGRREGAVLRGRGAYRSPLPSLPSARAHAHETLESRRARLPKRAPRWTKPRPSATAEREARGPGQLGIFLSLSLGPLRLARRLPASRGFA